MELDFYVDFKLTIPKTSNLASLMSQWDLCYYFNNNCYENFIKSMSIVIILDYFPTCI